MLDGGAEGLDGAGGVAIECKHVGAGFVGGSKVVGDLGILRFARGCGLE